MKNHFIRIALAIVLLSPCVSAQSRQINDPGNRQIPSPSFTGMGLSQETPRELPGSSLPHKLSTDFKPGIDAPGVKGSSFSARRLLSFQSLITVIDTAIIQSTQDTTRHLYSFNANARRTSDWTQKLVGDAWANRSRATDAYDAGGRLLSHLSEEWLSDQWTNSGRETYTYDAGGNLSSYLSEQWSGGQWVNLERHSYTYDANGKWTLHLSEQWSNGQWVTSGRETCSYDAAGRATQFGGEYRTNGQLTSTSRYTYTYDANGRSLSAEWVQSSSSGEQGMRITYAYDPNGNTLSTLNEVGSYGHWVNTNLETSTYDADGNVLSRLQEHWAGNHWIGQSRYTYTYDANMNKLSETSEAGGVEGQWAISSRRTFTYEVDGNTLTELYEQWKNGHMSRAMLWTSTYSASGRKVLESFKGVGDAATMNPYDSTFTYDANGRMLTRVYEERSNGELVIGDRYEYTYDAEGRTTSMSRHRWLNSSWTPADFEEFGLTVVRVVDGAGTEYDYSGHSFTFIYKDVVTGVAIEGGNVPVSYSLSQNYPNPFNPTTVFSYQVPVAGSVRLVVYDFLSREVAVLMDEHKAAGTYRVEFNGAKFSTGVYICRMTAGGFVQSRKMILLK